MKTIAFFDFDGTLTTKDTLLDFTRFAFGTPKFCMGLIYLLPFVGLFYLKIISRDSVARRFIHFFYQRKPLSALKGKSIQYIEERIPQITNPKVFNEFERHKQKGHEVVIVSASPFIWLEPWCRIHNADLLATRLVENHGILSGCVLGQRCIGQEKVEQINKTFNLNRYADVYAYGNSEGDVPMLNIADHSFYVKDGDLVSYPSFARKTDH